MTPLVRAEHLTRFYQGAAHPAVDRVSFDIAPGETLALVGESGSGKSTIGRLVLQLEKATAGRLWFDGQLLSDMRDRELKVVRPQMQMIFQDPGAALTPHMCVGDLVGEPLLIHNRETSKTARADRVAELFRMVGLDPAAMKRFPHEFSGGQRQRISIARALALNPRLIVADEPITALDVSIQAQIVNLLRDVQEQTGVTYLFISHDLGMVRHMSDRAAVMHAGRIVEIGATPQLFQDARHPYTRALLSAAPVANPAVARQRARVISPPPVYARSAGSILREVAPGHFMMDDSE